MTSIRGHRRKYGMSIIFDTRKEMAEQRAAIEIGDKHDLNPESVLDWSKECGISLVEFKDELLAFEDMDEVAMLATDIAFKTILSLTGGVDLTREELRVYRMVAGWMNVTISDCLQRLRSESSAYRGAPFSFNLGFTDGMAREIIALINE